MANKNLGENMNTGMLWFDNDPKVDLSTKIQRATEYYQSKYGQKPTLCFVHPSMITEKPARTGGIEVQGNQMVLPNHFWLGVKSAVRI
jgi:hypothetical protein